MYSNQYFVFSPLTTASGHAFYQVSCIVVEIILMHVSQHPNAHHYYLMGSTLIPKCSIGYNRLSRSVHHINILTLKPFLNNRSKHTIIT